MTAFNTNKIAAAVLISFLSAYAAAAGDAAAGRAKVEQQCAECHRRSDFSGETTAALQALLSDIVAGKVNHSRKTLQLTPAEIADIAAYLTARGAQAK